MRVLLVNDYSTPRGGAESIALGLRDGLRRRGHQALLFASTARYAGGPRLADAACLGSTTRLQTPLQAANPFAYASLRRVLASFRPDVVHVTMLLWQLSPLILPLLRDVPSVYYAVTYKAVCPTGSKQYPDGRPCRVRAGRACLAHGCLTPAGWPWLMLQTALWRRWCGAFARVVPSSEAVRRRLEEDGLGPLEVVLPGVPAVPARPPLADPPTAAFLGRLVPEKGVDVLLRAFARVRARLPAARLIVAGAGPAAGQIARLVDALGLGAAVQLPGPLARADSALALAPAWVQVVPSRWPEPLGLVAAEASMRGTAVIASATGGLPEIVRHGETGLLVPPDDVAALADALLQLLGDRARAERLGAAGRAYASTSLREDVFVDRMLALFRELVVARAARHGC